MLIIFKVNLEATIKVIISFTPLQILKLLIYLIKSLLIREVLSSLYLFKFLISITIFFFLAFLDLLGFK